MKSSFRMYLVLLISFSCTSAAFLETQLVPDCDTEFATKAMELVQNDLTDVSRIQTIHAILASCNKAMLQKLTEVSVLLLSKGTLATPLMENIRQISERSKITKANRIQENVQNVEIHLKPIIGEISSIYMNSSLSGNEKVTWANAALLNLPVKDRRVIQRILSNENTVPAPILPVLNGTPIEQTDTFGEVPPPLVEMNRQTSRREEKIPPSFVIEQAKDSTEVQSIPITREEIDEEKVHPHRSDYPLFGSTIVGTNIPPTIFNDNDPGASYIDMMTKNRRPSARMTAPIQPLVHTQGRPLSVSETDHSKAHLEDADLLKTRSNIWAEAAKFIEKTTNIPDELRKLWSQGQQSVNRQVERIIGPSNTFPLPPEAYERAKRLEDHLLPPRLNDDSKAIIPVNTLKSLDRFDTGMGRFDQAGPSNRVVLSSSISDTIPVIPINGMQNNNNPVPPPSNQHLLPKQQETRQEIRTYPGYRDGLFPLTENHATGDKPPAKQTIEREGGEIHKNINDKVEGRSKGIPLTDPAKYANGGVVSIENHPGLPYEIQPRPHQTIGEDLSETDPVGSIPMGRYDRKEYPRYPPPPISILPTTTVISVIKEALPERSRFDMNKFPYFPELGTKPLSPDPEMVRYIGPEEITGSRVLLRDVKNVRLHGQNRFVKIDLLNE